MWELYESQRNEKKSFFGFYDARNSVGEDRKNFSNLSFCTRSWQKAISIEISKTGEMSIVT